MKCLLDSISPTFNTILNESMYDSLTDLNGDGASDDNVIIPNPIAGDYSIRIVGKAGFADSARFTLTIRIDGNQLLIPDECADAEVSSLGTTLPSTTSYCPSTVSPGDCNASGDVTSSDIITLVNHVFKSAAAPVPEGICDVNCTGALTSSDII